MGKWEYGRGFVHLLVLVNVPVNDALVLDETKDRKHGYDTSERTFPLPELLFLQDPEHVEEVQESSTLHS